ncbi:MAG: hypothetical protein ACUVQM_02580 [Candidatus Hadarchaeaceae archaeon]
MREEHWYYSFWLIIIGSWILGIAYGKWWDGSGGLLSDIGKAISVPPPSSMEVWQPLLYFPLTTIAAFVLSQLFFGVGAAFFLFMRGVYESSLITSLETIFSGWKLTSITSPEIWTVLFIVLIFATNLPLCLWAAHLGTQRSIRMLYRLREKPTKPITGPELASRLILIITLSLIAGLTASFAIANT